MKLEIERFKQKGNIYIWKYTENIRNYPGWNLTVDKEGGNNLIDLLKLMMESEWSSKKVLETTQPTNLQTIVSPKNFSWKSKSTLILNYKNNYENVWEIIERENNIEIVFGNKEIIDFNRAINDILNRKSDFALSDSNEENILYFW